MFSTAATEIPIRVPDRWARLSPTTGVRLTARLTTARLSPATNVRPTAHLAQTTRLLPTQARFFTLRGERLPTVPCGVLVDAGGAVERMRLRLTVSSGTNNRRGRITTVRCKGEIGTDNLFGLKQQRKQELTVSCSS